MDVKYTSTHDTVHIPVECQRGWGGGSDYLYHVLMYTYILRTVCIVYAVNNTITEVPQNDVPLKLRLHNAPNIIIMIQILLSVAR